MENKYTKKDVKVLLGMIEENPNLAYEVMSAGTSPHTFMSMVRAYDYKLPRYAYNVFVWPNSNHFIYKIPFKEVPIYTSSESLKLLVLWRLKIGK